MLAHDLFEAYASELWALCGPSDLDPRELIASDEQGVFLAYPVRCLRLMEMIGMFGLLLEPDEQRPVAKWLLPFLERQPGAAHPISDRWTVSMLPALLLARNADAGGIGPYLERVVARLGDTHDGVIDLAPPYNVPELAKRAGASTGATYRVVEFLEEQELIERERRGPITDVRWRPLLERWSRDYGFAQSNTVATFLEPRGLMALTARLGAVSELDYVVTGSLAAERFAAYAPARLAMLYVREIATAAKLLELRPTTTGANVALASGDYDVAFERTQVVDGLRLAAVSQVAVDLLTGPGRNPSEAGALLEWMESNEPAWRR